jgi:hypothetical protein
MLTFERTSAPTSIVTDALSVLPSLDLWKKPVKSRAPTK